MKHLISLLSALFILSVPALAAAEPVFVVGQHAMGACSYWTNIQDAHNRFAYACSGYPMTVYVADAGDVNRSVAALEAKITELERRIAVLEAAVARN